MLTRVLRSLVLTTGIYSLIMCLYIVARVTIDQVDASTPFIYTVPYITIKDLALGSFLASVICIVLYLSLWGRLRTNA